MQCPVCSASDYRTRYVFGWGEILQCSRCGCAYTEGCNPEEMNRRAFSRHEANDAVDLYRLWARERLSTLMRFTTSGSLLEFGPGTGEFLYTAAQAGFHPVGIDRFPQLNPENRHPEVAFIQADARNFRSTRRFDAIAALHVLEHFRAPYEFLSAVRENLADSGYFLLEVPNYASPSRVIAGRRWRCFVSYHALHLTPRSLTILLNRAGFKVAYIETVGCSTTQLVGLGVPFVLRRLRLPSPLGWEPAGVLRKVASGIERPLRWGYNIRVVACKI